MTLLDDNQVLDSQVLAHDARQGERMLAAVHEFLGRFVSYPSAHAHVAHTLWIVHTHLMSNWESTPRLALLSPEPASGKTRALEVTELLVPNPVSVVNVSVAYLFRKVGSDDGATILFDEIDTIFGPKAKDNEDIRGLLNAGHRRGATAGRCVARGNVVITEEIPAYAPVALAGLGWLPDTLLSRSIIIRMRRRHASEPVEPFRRRLHQGEGWAIRDDIATWAQDAGPKIQWPSLPPQIVDRDADVWEPLIAIADAIGGDWPRLARVAGVALVAASKEVEPSLGIRLLADLSSVFDASDELSTQSVLEALQRIEDAPWSDLKGKPLDARGLAYRLRQYNVTPRTIRVGSTTPKGYVKSDLVDVWARYLSPSPPSAKSATSATLTLAAAHGGVPARKPTPHVALVEDVAAPAGGEQVCEHCRRPGGLFCDASVGGRSVVLHIGCKDAFRP